MATNREWLNGLAKENPHALAEWMDAQRDNDETCPIGNETCPNDGIEHSMESDSGQRELESDSREKLEEELDNIISDALRNLRRAIYQCVEQRMNVLSFSDGEFINFEHEEFVGEYVERAMKVLDRQAAITANETSHDNPYVGLVRGKQWERTERSDYYCGRCGWKVTDHNSYCPECGGALHKASNKPDSKFDARKTAEMPETDAAKGDIRDFDDSREKLEADAIAYCDHFRCTQKRFNETKLIALLDRQAAITRRTEQASWIQQANGLIYEANAERDRLKEELAKRDKGIERLKRQRDKAREELRKFNDISSEVKQVAAERDAMARDLAESDKLREELREKLSTALGHAHDILALIDLD